MKAVRSNETAVGIKANRAVVAIVIKGIRDDRRRKLNPITQSHPAASFGNLGVVAGKVVNGSILADEAKKR